MRVSAHARAQENVDHVDQGRVEDKPDAAFVVQDVGFRFGDLGLRVRGCGFRFFVFFISGLEVSGRRGFGLWVERFWVWDERPRDCLPGGPDALHCPPPVEGK